MNQVDADAADLIVSLWGKKRRQYARRYWLFLTRGMERPLMAEVFGSEWIEQRLRKIGEGTFHWKGE